MVLDVPLMVERLLHLLTGTCPGLLDLSITTQQARTLTGNYSIHQILGITTHQAYHINYEEPGLVTIQESIRVFMWVKAFNSITHFLWCGGLSWITQQVRRLYLVKTRVIAMWMQVKTKTFGSIVLMLESLNWKSGTKGLEIGKLQLLVQHM